MLRALQLKTLWQIVSEIKLEDVQKEVEAPFHLLIAGDGETDASEAARHLSTADAEFVHPWLTVTDSDGSGMRTGMDPVDCALLLTKEIELSQNLSALHSSLDSAKIPVLVLVIGPNAAQPGADIPHRQEQAREAVAEWSPVSVALVARRLLEIVPSELRLALAFRLPPLRPAAIQQLIQETSQANATYSFTTGLAETIPVLGLPLNVSDLLVLTKNQLMMAYKIALISGKSGTPQQLLGEIVSVLGGGFLFRQLAREMVGLIPVWGILPKVAVAYAGTWTIGRAVTLWAAEGRRITPDLLKSFYRDALVNGRRAAQEIVGKARSRSAQPQEKLPAPAEDSPTPSLWQRVRRRAGRRGQTEK